MDSQRLRHFKRVLAAITHANHGTGPRVLDRLRQAAAYWQASLPAVPGAELELEGVMEASRLAALTAEAALTPSAVSFAGRNVYGGPGGGLAVVDPAPGASKNAAAAMPMPAGFIAVIPDTPSTRTLVNPAMAAPTAAGPASSMVQGGYHAGGYGGLGYYNYHGQPAANDGPDGTRSAAV